MPRSATLLLPALGLMFLGTGADPASSAGDPVAMSEPSRRKLVEFRDGVEPPFALNDKALREWTEEENRIATKKYAEIKRQLAELILHHPDTPAAREATALLDRSELRVFPDGGIYPRGTFISVVPILR